MSLSTCASLTEKIIINCEKALPNANKGHLQTSRGLEIAEYFGGSWEMCDSLHECYDTYQKNPSLENSKALCAEVWKHINPDIRVQVTNETSDDECGECDDAQKGGVHVHTIVIQRL